MAGISLEHAEAQLAAWTAASLAVAAGQAYEISDGGMTRQMTRVNAEHIDRMIVFWEGRVNRLSRGRGGARTRQIAPG